MRMDLAVFDGELFLIFSSHMKVYENLRVKFIVKILYDDFCFKCIPIKWFIHILGPLLTSLGHVSTTVLKIDSKIIEITFYSLSF